MSITLTLIAFNRGRLLFDAFVAVVLNIMSKWGYNGTRLMRLNISGRSKLIEI